MLTIEGRLIELGHAIRRIDQEIIEMRRRNVTEQIEKGPHLSATLEDLPTTYNDLRYPLGHAAVHTDNVGKANTYDFLIEARNAWRGDAKDNLYCIHYYEGDDGKIALKVYPSTKYFTPFRFPTDAMAEKFAKTFYHLFQEIRDYIT